MVYLYADPIVREDNGKIVPCETPLNLEEEYPMVLETLKSTGKHFYIKKEPINYQSLSLIIQQRPKILHISSHGFFDKNTNQFYLAIEKEGKEGGLEDQFSSDRLSILLRQQSKGKQI